MELFLYLRSLTCCCCSSPTSTSKTTTYHPASNTTTFATTSTTVAAIKSRLSSTISDLFKDRQQEARQDMQERGEEDCLIDAARSLLPSRPLVFGTIYGHRRGHVSFCVQQDPATLPPFLFEFSMTTDLLAREMATGLVRIALECPRNSPGEHHPPYSASSSTTPAPRRSLRAGPLWKAFCNGRKVGYAVKRSPSVKDLRILNTVRSMSAGAGVIPCMDGDGHDDGAEKGELMYMRASYERVMGSRDSVAYHLINPGGSPAQELSVFLVRSG